MSPRKRRSKRPHSARFAPALAVDDADCADGANADEEEKNDERDVELEQPDEAPDAPPATAPKRKAFRGDAAALGVTAGEARYAPRTHTNSLLNKRGLSFGDPAARYRRARKAAEASWRVVEDEERDARALFNGPSSRPTAEMASARRHAISYVFESIFGSPPEPKWAGRATDREGGIIAKISLRLAIPSNSSKLVRKVLQDTCAAALAGEQYDADASAAHGRRALLTLDMPEGKLALEALERGVGIAEATVLVNEFRAAKDETLEPVSWSAVQGFNARCPASDTRRRTTKKSGKDDVDSVLAKARVPQCQQFKRQLALGAADAATRAADKSGEPPLLLDGLAFWDEHHDKIRLGHAAKHETRLARDPTTGDITIPDAGGVFPERKPVTTVKFPGEARGCFGACMRTKLDGTKEGVTLEPFQYTGTMVVGNAKFDKAVAAEMRRVLPLAGVWRRPGFGYNERYGADRGLMEAAKVVSTSGKMIPVTLVRRWGTRRARSRALVLTAGSLSMWRGGGWGARTRARS